jgi:hypothetical protein
MTAMSHHSGAERLLGALHEVVAATTMAMKLNASRHHMHSQSVNSRVGTWLDVAILANLYNARILKQQRTTAYPPRRSENLTIVNLG